MSGIIFNGTAIQPNTRDAEVCLIVKYGLKRIERFKQIFKEMPNNIPEKPMLKLLSEMMNLSVDNTDMLMSDTVSLAPEFLNLNRPVTETVLSPPVKACLKGCIYVNSGARSLVTHKKAKLARLYDINGSIKLVRVVSLMCTGCKSRYSYSKWHDYDRKCYFLYNSPRECVEATRKVYITDALRRDLLFSVLHTQSTFQGYAEVKRQANYWSKGFSRRIVSAAFWKSEIYCALYELGMLDYPFKDNLNIFQCLHAIEKRIMSERLLHQCSSQCVKFGCGRGFICDGLWKIGFRHCAAEVIATVTNIQLVNFPNVCIKENKGLSNYCVEHQYLKGESAGSKCSGPEQVASEIQFAGLANFVAMVGSQVNDVLSIETVDEAETACSPSEERVDCSKDFGENGRSFRYSRGYFFIVRETGHIEMFAPLYRSESPGQVFLILIVWLYQLLQNVPENEWGNIFLAYDAMCKLDRLRAARQPLPLPKPYDEMWFRISKIIDGLHIRNHKDKRCEQHYGPNVYFDRIGTEGPRNTMAAEKTFAWLNKFKKQANSMNRNRQFFFIYRIAVRRNTYVSQCMLENRKPVGPTMRNYADKN